MIAGMSLHIEGKKKWYRTMDLLAELAKQGYDIVESD